MFLLGFDKIFTFKCNAFQLNVTLGLQFAIMSNMVKV